MDCIEYTVGRTVTIFGKMFIITWMSVRRSYGNIQDDVLKAPRGTIRFAYGTWLKGRFVKTANKPVYAMIETADAQYLYDAVDNPYREGTVITVLNA